MINLLLIRHALTDSVGKRLSGRLPGVPLNATGRQQAQELALRLTHVPLAAIYSSPLERAVETAEPVAQSHQLETLISEDFLEINFGDWTNASFEELQTNPTFKNFNTFRSNTRIPGGEMMLEAQTRVITGIEKLYQKHHQQTIAIVSHSDLIKAALAYYAGIHLDLFQRVEISPASVSVVQIFPETAKILVINDTGEIQL
ncbi:histidine phosphatase family protein [Adhaeribacter pallidiroseus]|uniref:Adenosylcobalamin/alpha-ribazole phosphatase n=1 Tax=Adhaeribacter pallidiroseus TaxID=2072847 RepID=A0A369QNI1_9BACT|nr:histidine phosphatase family protein [Adhaeribacter pallidiroseus]RDC64816.1 Adenosylcobalamin/alpha-ribazole phosphatase [Adhaeribacter pallidiroseus]